MGVGSVLGKGFAGWKTYVRVRACPPSLSSRPVLDSVDRFSGDLFGFEYSDCFRFAKYGECLVSD